MDVVWYYRTSGHPEWIRGIGPPPEAAEASISSRPDTVQPRALLSVSNKSGLVEFARRLHNNRYEIISTGGTFKTLQEAGIPVTYVSDITGHPEVFDGRVKTLHPKIHGGILLRRDRPSHLLEAQTHDIRPIDIVVVNLYPFEETVAKPNVSDDEAIENIDIGGPAMIRAAAKNHSAVTVVVSPTDYERVVAEIEANGETAHATRRQLALKAFQHTAAYDAAIAHYFAAKSTPDNSGTAAAGAELVSLALTPRIPLKYGCNPHQKPATVLTTGARPLPFEVVNGRPGYINLCDALNGWQLVKELRAATGLPAAASFKHVSPAGAAVYVELSDIMKKVYEVPRDAVLSPLAVAYIRARGADPMCSFGDFIALSDEVDESTANYIAGVVSDGIIAPGFSEQALSILRKKKSGEFAMIKIDPAAEADDKEYRSLFGVVLQQGHNNVKLDETILANIVTKNKDLSQAAKLDLLVTTIAVKYTQSNSVGYGLDGQVIGLGAGQQSRVDCVKLAGRKVETWFMRQHPKVLDLKFKAGVKKQERINARVRYIEGDMSEVERAAWAAQFDDAPTPLTAAEKEAFLQTLSGVSISSDAFFPFRDNIDQAVRRGVTYVVETGGSARDDEVIAAADEYNLVMAFSNIRLFHH